MKNLLVFVNLFLAIHATRGANLFKIEKNEQCSAQESTFLVGAEKALPGAFPYQVSIRLGDENTHSCGGSIISDRWILTAAHCLYGLEPGDVRILVGTNELETGGEVYQAEKLVAHSDYNEINTSNDVGLILVNKSIEFNDLIKPVDLPTGITDESDRSAIVSGWGKISTSGPISNELQYIVTCIIDREKCLKLTYVVNIDQKVCSLSRAGQGICLGDSGGPLVADDVQIGIVSYHILLCGYGFPDFYTRVSAYLDWIHEQTGILH